MKHKDDIKGLNMGKARLLWGRRFRQIFCGPLNTRYNEIWVTPSDGEFGGESGGGYPTNVGKTQDRPLPKNLGLGRAKCWTRRAQNSAPKAPFQKKFNSFRCKSEFLVQFQHKNTKSKKEGIYGVVFTPKAQQMILAP